MVTFGAKINSQMKKLSTVLMTAATVAASFGQTQFDKTINIAEFNYLNSTMLMPKSPLTTQVLFIGGVDMVQTTATYGNAAGATIAKEWHDFIGITPDTTAGNENEFWISVNHEMVEKNDMVGDGGGMTAFKAMEDANGNVTILEQTLTDGRTGKFFNVDFVNTVGETGMNCGGITSSVDGRIWTAEEWFRTSNGSLVDSKGDTAVRDLNDFTINTDITGNFNGKTVKKFQNFNYMVEIDPREAKAIRKQYNWGRQGFEGGVVMADNKTVFLGIDNTPAYFLKFVAKTAGDFTEGDLFVYKQDSTVKWIKVDNQDINVMLNLDSASLANHATMFNRKEWVALDKNSGMLYITETGRDNPGSAWSKSYAAGAKFAAHHVARASAQGTTPENSKYLDIYGRVLKFDPTTDEMTVLIEGGAGETWDNKASFGVAKYPSKHLSNPDGLNTIVIGSQTYLLICEDLNGVNYNRMPYAVNNPTCELFMLDLSIDNPTVNDLIRITAVPQGAEITGVTVTPSNKTILVNSQHPESSENVNTYPFNHSLTFAITGFEGIISALAKPSANSSSEFVVYPNPVSREVYVSSVTDIALYDALGQRVRVAYNTDKINVEGLATGTYIVLTKEGKSTKIIIE